MDGQSAFKIYLSSFLFRKIPSPHSPPPSIVQEADSQTDREGGRVDFRYLEVRSRLKHPSLKRSPPQHVLLRNEANLNPAIDVEFVSDTFNLPRL